MHPEDKEEKIKEQAYAGKKLQYRLHMEINLKALHNLILSKDVLKELQLIY